MKWNSSHMICWQTHAILKLFFIHIGHQKYNTVKRTFKSSEIFNMRLRRWDMQMICTSAQLNIAGTCSTVCKCRMQRENRFTFRSNGIVILMLLFFYLSSFSIFHRKKRPFFEHLSEFNWEGIVTYRIANYSSEKSMIGSDLT